MSTVKSTKATTTTKKAPTKRPAAPVVQAVPKEPKVTLVETVQAPTPPSAPAAPVPDYIFDRELAKQTSDYLREGDPIPVFVNSRTGIPGEVEVFRINGVDCPVRTGILTSAKPRVVEYLHSIGRAASLSDVSLKPYDASKSMGFYMGEKT